MISGGSDTSYRKQSVVGRRMFILSAAKIVVFGGIIAQLFSLQIKQNKKYKKPNSSEKKALLDLILNLEKCSDDMRPEDIQTEIYTVGKNNGYKENLREWFKLIYEVVFGVENGPRLGFFISFFGRKEMILLIKEKIN